jgi:subtilisin family serine protease
MIVFIAISFGLTLLITKYLSGTDSNESVPDDYDVVDTANDTITSWYLSESKDLDIFVNDYNAWKEDDPSVNTNIKINEPMNEMSEKRSTIIAVLDSDIDVYDTLDNTKIWVNDGEIEGDKRDNDENGFIDDYCGWNFCDDDNVVYDKKNHGIHGTYISSLLIGKDEANNFEGLVYDYNVEIMSLKVLYGVDERGNVNSIVEGIQYAENMGAQICCLSLASPRDYSELKLTIEKSNMLFVVAAGNDGFELGNPYFVYPGCYNYDNMITVADIRCDGELSHSSNYGKEFVDIAAPGSDIVGMIPNGNFIYLSGTSSATAIVAGAAAIVRNISSDCMKPREIKKVLLDNAKVTDKLKDCVYANGYLYITKSIN